MSYKVSVIIPSYNAKNVISRAIDSIKNQTIGFENIELIIVDDNSNDSTKEILREYDKEYSNIKCILNNDNSGTPSRGRNIGIDNSSSKYLMFLDQDDQYAPDICEILYDSIEKFNVDIVMCDYRTVDNNQFSTPPNKNKEYIEMVDTDPKNNEFIFLDNFMWNKIFKTDFIRKYDIKCPDGLLGEDTYFCMNAYLNTNRLIYLKGYVGYYYNIRDNKYDSSTSNNFDENRFFKFFEGYYGAIKYLKDADRFDLINILLKNHFIILISFFVRLDANHDKKIEILDKLRDFKEYSNFEGPVNEKWAEIINKNLKNRNYTFIIYYSSILNQFYKLNFLRNVYRRVYKKLDK